MPKDLPTNYSVVKGDSGAINYYLYSMMLITSPIKK